MRLPCENDQAKLDHFSRLACSTNLSKILKVYPPKRGLWIEARTVTSGCPRTCCAWLVPARFSYSSERLGPFLREPSKFIEFSSLCQAQSFSSLQDHSAVGYSPVAALRPLLRFPDQPKMDSTLVRSLALRKISKIDQRISRRKTRGRHLSH